MKQKVQNHLNQAAFLSGVAASGFLQTGLKAASATRKHLRPNKHEQQERVVLGRVKYRPNVKEPVDVLKKIKNDLDDIKDALVDIAEKR